MPSIRWFAILVLVGCSGEPSAAPGPTAPASKPAPVAAPDAGVAAGSGSAVANCKDDEDEPPPPTHDQLTLTKTDWKSLPSWADDKHAEAVPSFLRSCEKLAALKDNEAIGHDGHGGLAKHWRKACAAAQKVKAGDHAAAKAMFEAQFVPWTAAGKGGVDGKMTGYYVQEMRGSRKKHGKYQYPVYARPKDLVMVDLSKHIKDAHGRRIWGRLDAKGDLVPFHTRGEIRLGALAGKGLEIMYVDSPVDLLFSHIEGSAKVVMEDKSVVWLEFAGKNGRAYRGVGGVLKSIGALQKPGSGTMQGIRAWFEANPKRFDEVVDQSHSFVFFAESKAPGAVGSQMVVMTARRSMAIDRAFIAHSTPIWVETRAPKPGKPGSELWHQLLIAQDTGGGIQGAVRGDIYWGDDSVAADLGGRMGGGGRYWLLLPKGVTK